MVNAVNALARAPDHKSPQSLRFIFINFIEIVGSFGPALEKSTLCVIVMLILSIVRVLLGHPFFPIGHRLHLYVRH